MDNNESLMDITKEAALCGFSTPVFMTKAAFDKVGGWNDVDTALTGHQQDEGARLSEVLTVLKNAAAKGRYADLNTLPFQVRVIMRDVRNAKGGVFIPMVAVAKREGKKLTTLTIMLSGET